MKKALVAISFFVLASCSQTKVDLDQERQKITESWMDWPEKSVNGAPEFYFDEDATMLGPKIPTLKGKKEIAGFYAAMPKIKGMVIKWNDRPNIIGLSTEGDMAYSVDTLRLSIPDSTGALQTEVSRGIHIWRKNAEGNWRVVLLTLYPTTSIQN